jgi:hypothetical protein
MGGDSSNPINQVDPVATAIQMQTSCNGNPIPIVYGRTRVTGNIIWYGDFTAVPHVNPNGGDGGGKGGGGGGGSAQTSWTYTASFAMGLCEGTVGDILSMWSGKSHTQGFDTSSTLGFFSGPYPQGTWPYMDSLHPDQSLTYSGIAYIIGQNYNLGTDTNMPAFSFEIHGKFPDPAFGFQGANPKDIVYDLLTNAHYGAGFASSKIADLTSYLNYCGAMGLFLSPVYDTQIPVAQILTDLMQITNSGIYFSEGVLKIVPYGDQNVTGNNYTYTAPSSTLINLGDDDFIVDSPSDDPVLVKRNAIPTTANTSSDAFNQVSLEYLNRLNEYNPEVVMVQDQNSIDTFGLIPMSSLQAHQITDPSAAYTAASLIVQRSVYIRNQYEFRLGWNYAYLEPTDIVTLTDSGLGVTLKPVRILIVEEDEKGTLSITAEDAPPGVASRVWATPGTGSGYSANYNVSPGNVFTPAFFEPPVQDVAGTSGIEVWVGATGQAGNTGWGGANVWVSNDGNSYTLAGQVTAPARVGHLTANLAAGSAGPLSLQLDGLGGQIIGGSAADAANLSTLLCILGANPEFVAYQGATLTGVNAYSLSGLIRGAYSSTNGAHNIGDVVVRVDGAIAKGNPLDISMIGKPIFFKFCSFNIYGANTQNLADVPAYQYTVTGSALKAPLANVTNLLSVFKGSLAVLSWDVVIDPVRTVDYEVRKGATWATAQVLGRTLATTINADGDGVYWVSAHSDLAYSSAPTSITIVGAALIKNVVATVDEFGTGLLGTLGGGVCIINGNISLGGASSFSTITTLSTIPDVGFFGGVSSSGSYTIPATHEVDIGNSQPCNCSVSYTVRSDNPFDLFSNVSDVAALASIAGNYSGQSGVTIQIATSDNSGTYGAWVDFVPGAYNGRKFKFKALLFSTDPSVLALISSFVFTVDVPDRNDRGTAVAIAAGGTSITYLTPFQVTPNLQITIVNASQGDDVLLSAQTASGATIQIVNGGVGVERTINWLAQAY